MYGNFLDSGLLVIRQVCLVAVQSRRYHETEKCWGGWQSRRGWQCLAEMTHGHVWTCAHLFFSKRSSLLRVASSVCCWGLRMELGDPDIIIPWGRLGAGVRIWYADISAVAAEMEKENHKEFLCVCVCARARELRAKETGMNYIHGVLNECVRVGER